MTKGTARNDRNYGLTPFLPFELLQVTAEYSNAVLLAVMPYVSDFAQRLDLPISQPVTVAQVRRFACSPRSDHIGGRVFLTNDYSFTFAHGIVMLYRSPESYYSLQDAKRVPEFYGQTKLAENEAIQVARDAIRKLGFTNTTFHAERPPRVHTPAQFTKKNIPRYLVEWLDPADEGHAAMPKATLQVEVNASNGQVEMLGILTKAAWRPDLEVGVHPAVLARSPGPQPYGPGSKVYPVSLAYGQAFLTAILPQLSDHAKKGGFDLKLPIVAEDVDMSRYECGLVRGLPIASVYLKSGDRFWYEHGFVTDYEAANAVRLPGNETNPPARFFGPDNMSDKEAVALVTKAITQLGYRAALPELDMPPRVVSPTQVARYFLSWRVPRREWEPLADAEVDATKKKLVGLYLNAAAVPKLWRDPPKIDVPTGAVIPDHEEPVPSAPLPSDTLPPVTPPGSL
jgi:hypothetical protein